DGGENYPLVLQQFAGAGRVIFFGFEETWRWRYRSEEEQFNRFWRQTVRVLARNRVARTELRTDRQTPYRRDEPITITVQFPEDAPAPSSGVKIRLDATSVRGDRETQRLTLTKREGTRGTFQSLVTRTPEGTYRFTLEEPSTPSGGTVPSAEATVLPPAGEMDRIDVNRADLVRAATESRGKFYTLAEADKWIEELPDGIRVPLNQPCPPVPIWNHAASFALLVLLLAFEWWMRRQERLL
ncbi:MAG: hypothetical protein ACRCZF_04110, partial [Gemmataceae bacterium]